MGVAAQLLHRGEEGTAHGAQHPSGEGEPGELGQQVRRPGVHWHPGAPLQKGLGLSGDVLFLHEKGEGLIAPIQRPLNDLGALGDEDALLRLPAVSQLGLGEAGEGVQPRVVQGVDIDDICHVNSS